MATPTAFDGSLVVAGATDCAAVGLVNKSREATHRPQLTLTLV